MAVTLRDEHIVMLLLQAQNPSGQLVAEAAAVATYSCQARECLWSGKHLDCCSRCRRRCQPGCLNQSIGLCYCILLLSASNAA